MLRTKDFKVYFTKKTIDCATNFELEISKIAVSLLYEIYNSKILYRATGIYLGDLSCNNGVQTTLFSEDKQKENSALALAIDKLENKFGRNIIRTGF